MNYKQLMKIGVATSTWSEVPSDEIPSATRFFEHLDSLDPEYFSNAAERITYKDQSLDFIEAFGRFYCIDSDGERMRFGIRYAMENHLENRQKEADAEYEQRQLVQRDIDNHLLTA